MIDKKIEKKFNLLSDKEKSYFRIMWGKYGVLYITSKPGIAKSAIAKHIADVMGYQYMDIRLSMIDEVDVGLYPVLNDVKIGDNNMKTLSFAVPEWAIRANQCPTIIHFEELNRATLQVRNAALQILLERQIGTDFRFNDNVLMMSSGNLGEEDNCDVEYFDNALNNRLIHINHNLTIDDWITSFAKDNVYAPIIDFIKIHPEHFYRQNDNNNAFATPRTWTMLSKYITENYGIEVSMTPELIKDLTIVARGYIGSSADTFIRYCNDNFQLSINDILKDFDKNINRLKEYKRDKQNELIMELEKKDISKFTKTECNNCIKFIQILQADEKIAYLTNLFKYMLNNNIDTTGNYKEILKPFKKDLINISEKHTKRNIRNEQKDEIYNNA